MAKVFKYTMKPGGNVLELPVGAEFLAAAEQTEHPDSHFVAWFKVHEGRPTEKRFFEAVPTGVSYDDSLVHFLTTVVCNGGRLVWHLHEAIKA